MNGFCKLHHSHFCPCSKPHLYRGERERIAAWGIAGEEIERILDEAAKPRLTLVDRNTGSPFDR